MIPTIMFGKIGHLVRLGRTYPNQLVKRAEPAYGILLRERGGNHNPVRNVKKMEET